MYDGGELCGIAVAGCDQLRFGGDAVLLLQGVEGVEACGEFGQPFGVGVEAFAVGGYGVVDVLQLLEYGVQACGVFPGRGEMFADACQVVLGIFQEREHPGFVGIEGVAERSEHLADAVGVLQYGQFFLDGGLFPFAQVGSREFFALEAEPLLVAASVGGGFAQGGEPAPQFRKPRVLRGILCEQFPVPGHGVERRGAELFRGEDQVLMLRVDVDQAGAEFAQLGQLHREVVDEGAALAGRGYHARYGSLRRIVEVVPGEESLHVAPREVEGAFDHAVACGVLHGRAVVLGAQQQAEGTEQDGFPGSRFTRDDIQVGIQLHFELVDKHVVLNRQTA